MVIKVHHAVIDGVSGTDVLAHLLDLEPDSADEAPRTPAPCYTRKTQFTLEILKANKRNFIESSTYPNINQVVEEAVASGDEL